MKYNPHGKRVFDILFSVFSFIILLPLMVLISVVLLFTSSSPVIFTQRRIGKDGKTFLIYKFRTMRENTPEVPSRDLNEEEYVSRFGAFLRRSGLDELPQLINIIRGEMSLVGPRPLIVDEKEMHEMRMAKQVYSVAPGLTGLSQIRCHAIKSLSEKAECDAEYVKHISFCTDIRILFGTIGKMFSDKGIKENLK